MNNNSQNPENPEKKPFDRAEYNRNYQKEYRKKNIEKKKAYDKQYKQEHREENKAYQRERQQNNPEKNRAANKKSREAHLEERKAYDKRYKEEHREENKAYGKVYREEHKEEARAYRQGRAEETRVYNREYVREKRKTDPTFRLIENMRSRVSSALRCKDSTKNKTTIDLLGCTPEFLKNYLESLFAEGMTWDNYGKKGWHVDHIIPCASFDLTKEEEQKECFHYTNLQPLWWLDNIKKSDKIL